MGDTVYDWGDIDITLVDPDLILPQGELEALSPAEEREYLKIVRADAARWKLQARQQVAEDLAGTVDELLYGGAAGGGKTDWMTYHAYQQCLLYPGLRVLGIRRTFPQLRKSLIERSLMKFDPAVATYKDAARKWVFKNGSEIEYGYCDADTDWRHYLSAEYDLILFEELTELTEMQYKMISSRARTTKEKIARGIRPHVIAATNPGQIGHAWVKKYFVDSTNYGEHTHTHRVEVHGKVGERTVAFVPAKVSDNRHIDPSYIFNLGALPERERKRYLDGDWDIFEGQYFQEFNRDVHVIDPFEIPKTWTKARAIDYGFAAPFACLWAAWDQDGNMFIFKEAYAKQLTAREQAALIRKMSEKDSIDYTICDPSMFNRTGTGVSIAAQYRENGINVRPAMNARVDGWNRVRDYLRGDPKVADSGPYLRIFRTCSNLIEELPNLVYDKDRPEDCDTTGADHASDAARYLAMSRPRKHEVKAGPVDPRSFNGRLEAITKRRVNEGRSDLGW